MHQLTLTSPLNPFHAGLSVREEADGHMRVVRTSVGTALQPSPSWQRASEAPNEQNVKSIADSFVALLAGKGLGTGMALRSNSSLLRGRSAPGGRAAAVLCCPTWVQCLGAVHFARQHG